MCMLHDNEPGQDDEPPILRGDAPPGMFTPRWEELQETYGIDRPRGLTRSVIFIHRLPQDYGILHMPPWGDRVVATPDLWPDELIDDITGWFDDLRGRWSEEEWWVRRIHRAASVSRVSILQEVNYVLITRHDFEFYARNPHGLMELGFRDPQIHTTVLPQLINMPTLCHKLSTWPYRTHSSCTDTLRYSPVGISTHTYSKTEVPQCIYREAIGLSSAGRST